MRKYFAMVAVVAIAAVACCFGQSERSADAYWGRAVVSSGAVIHGQVTTFCASGCIGTSGGTFNCPSGSGVIEVCGCGGGGGGGAGGAGPAFANNASGGGGGGGGSMAYCSIAICTPGALETVTLGSGG